jgi:hypothetical protein
MRALQKAGLVELPESAPSTDSEAAAALEQFRATLEPKAAAAAPPPPAPPPAAGSPAEAGLPVEIGRSNDEIYREAAVPSSPFPAEKLLKVLDGLRMLDPPARKAAVAALDAADDAWSIDDVLLDAQRKMAALEGAKKRLQALADSVAAEARERITEGDRILQETTARIRQQISDLEGLLEREIGRSATDRAAQEHEARSTQDACTAESQKLDAEVRRLDELGRIFAEPQAPAR